MCWDRCWSVSSQVTMAGRRSSVIARLTLRGLPQDYHRITTGLPPDYERTTHIVDSHLLECNNNNKGSSVTPSHIILLLLLRHSTRPTHAPAYTTVTSGSSDFGLSVTLWIGLLGSTLLVIHNFDEGNQTLFSANIVLLKFVRTQHYN